MTGDGFPTAQPRRTALVTGASHGLGAVVARFLAGIGFELTVTGRRRPDLDAVVGELRALGATASGVPGDVADPAHRARLAEIVAGSGRLDLLVNNASELGASPLRPLSEVELDDFRRVLEVNVLAPVALVRAVRPELERAHGLVVNISSDAAVAAYERWGTYGASKAALDLISRTLAAELRSSGVSVVSVDPGDMRTAMHQAAFAGEDISDRPLPEVTLPFWAWLLGESPGHVSGQRFRAQAETWEIAS
ncbi:MAG TPA: SDR family NAD(P)-dependent oxidoreductase [Thermoplasmata archaeon]|nr:SDR family NAD(P)-dependent oxidoreductase [Thermoplasmata archaeon]